MDGLHRADNDQIMWTDGQAAPPPQPPSAAMSMPPAPLSDGRSERPRRRLGLLIGIIAAVVILVGGGAFAYTQGYLPETVTQFLGGVTFDSILEDMQKSSSTASGTGTISLSFGEGPRDKDATVFPLDQAQSKAELGRHLLAGLPVASAATSFTIESIPIDGLRPTTQFDPISDFWKNYTPVAGTLNMDIGTGSLDSDSPVMRLRIDGDVSMNSTTFAYDLEGRMVNKKIFARATKLPAIPLVPLEKITGTWYVADLPQDFLNEWKLAQSGQDTEQVKTILEAVRLAQKETKFFVVEKKLASEVIDGVKTKHVRVSFKTAQLKAFVKSFFSHADQLKVEWPADIGAARQELEKAFDDEDVLKQVEAYLKNASHDLFVDTKNGRLMGYDWTVRLVPPDSVTALKEKQINITLKSRTTGINAPVTVEEPTGAKPFTEALTAVLGDVGFFNTDSIDVQSFVDNPLPPVLDDNSIQVTPPDTSTLDTDGDGLLDSTEEILGTDPSKQDTDGDGYDDKQEIETGHDPINPPVQP